MADPIPITQQVDVAGRMVAQLEAALAAAKTTYDRDEIETITYDLDAMRAVRTTLAWLAKDRDGCVKLLTTRWNNEPARTPV